MIKKRHIVTLIVLLFTPTLLGCFMIEDAMSHQEAIVLMESWNLRHGSGDPAIESSITFTQDEVKSLDEFSNCMARHSQQNGGQIEAGCLITRFVYQFLTKSKSFCQEFNDAFLELAKEGHSKEAVAFNSRLFNALFDSSDRVFILFPKNMDISHEIQQYNSIYCASWLCAQRKNESFVTLGNDGRLTTLNLREAKNIMAEAFDNIINEDLQDLYQDPTMLGINEEVKNIAQINELNNPDNWTLYKPILHVDTMGNKILEYKEATNIFENMNDSLCIDRT